MAKKRMTVYYFYCLQCNKLYLESECKTISMGGPNAPRLYLLCPTHNTVVGGKAAEEDEIGGENNE
ncbi:MAG TPA: hypothetical protein VKK79_10255 [Candidatus Lokiarchaeia archaeon]|nr:hypothetical protein [Candidatus Lokiarchaeia archaeon]